MYNPHNWVSEEIITAEKLNNIETGVQDTEKEIETIRTIAKGDKGDTGTVDNAGLISAPAFQSLQTQVDNSAVGTNLLLDSKTQTRTPSWTTGNNDWTKDQGTYLGSNIKYVTAAWINARYSYKDLLDRGVINTTDDFTYSIYFRVVGEDPAGMSYASARFYSIATTKNSSIALQLTSLKEGQWTRIVVPFKFMDAKYDPTNDYHYSIRVEMSAAPKVAGARYEFAAPKLEKGSVATDWCPNPSEILTQGDSVAPEVTDARKDIDGVYHQSLSERLESTDKVTKVYDSIDDLRAANLNNGDTVKTQYNHMVQNWKIGIGGRDNGHSMIIMNNGLYASRVYDKYNDWLDGIGTRDYAAHKGFNGISESVKRDGIYPSNTLASFNAAAKVGFNFIELDARCTADGDWVVIHDADTTFTDGEKTNISDITTDDLKKRTLLSEYVGYGYKWVYESETTGYTIPLLKDVLQVAKYANMHVMLEIKVDSATNEQIEKLVNDIKKSGIEDKIVLFGGAIGLVEEIAEFVPNVIVGFMGLTDTESNINEIKSFKNHYLTTSVDKIDTVAPICQKFDIPFGVWTVDSYDEAQTAFNKGAMFVTTNRLLPNSSCTNMKPYQAFNLDDLLNNFRDNGTGGTTSANLNGEVSIKSSGTYFSKTKIFGAGQVKRGAVIKVTCTAKTVSANPSTNVGRIYIVNDNSNNMGALEDVMTFDDNYFTTKTMYYPITEDMESYLTVLSVGLAGQSISGTSEMLIKDFDCTVLVPATIDISNDRYCNIYAWDGAPIIAPTITNKGITSVAVDPKDTSALLVNFKPFYDSSKNPVAIATINNQNSDGYNNNRFIVASAYSATTGQIKLNVYKSDNTKVTDLRTGLRTGFNLLIKC